MRYPLELRFTPSFLLIALIAALHLVAAIAILQLSMVWPWWPMVWAVLGISLALAVRAEISKRTRFLALEEAGTLCVRGHGVELRALPAGCVDLGWAIWLAWRALPGDAPPPEKGAMMLLRDNLHADHWRLLRIWLRHKLQDPDAVSDTEIGRVD